MRHQGNEKQNMSSLYVVVRLWHRIRREERGGGSLLWCQGMGNESFLGLLDVGLNWKEECRVYYVMRRMNVTTTSRRIEHKEIET